MPFFGLSGLLALYTVFYCYWALPHGGNSWAFLSIWLPFNIKMVSCGIGAYLAFPLLLYIVFCSSKLTQLFDLCATYQNKKRKNTMDTYLLIIPYIPK